MALIDGRGVVIADEWTYPNTEEGQVRKNVVIPLEVMSEIDGRIELSRPVGVLVASDTLIERIVPFLDRLDLVVVEFPKFRDGRGFTIARALRERHAFKGDIRAIGHVLPDQFTALVQCGFTSIVTPPEHSPEQWTQNSTPQVKPGVRSGQLLHRLFGRGITKDEGN